MQLFPVHRAMGPKKIEVYETEEEVISKLCQKIQVAADKAIETNDIFKIGLSGSHRTVPQHLINTSTR